MKLCSALEGDGVGQVWEVMAEFRQKMEETSPRDNTTPAMFIKTSWFTNYNDAFLSLVYYLSLRDEMDSLITPQNKIIAHFF